VTREPSHGAEPSTGSRSHPAVPFRNASKSLAPPATNHMGARSSIGRSGAREASRDRNKLAVPGEERGARQSHVMPEDMMISAGGEPTEDTRYTVLSRKAFLRSLYSNVRPLYWQSRQEDGQRRTLKMVASLVLASTRALLLCHRVVATWWEEKEQRIKEREEAQQQEEEESADEDEEQASSVGSLGGKEDDIPEEEDTLDKMPSDSAPVAGAEVLVDALADLAGPDAGALEEQLVVIEQLRSKISALARIAEAGLEELREAFKAHLDESARMSDEVAAHLAQTNERIQAVENEVLKARQKLREEFQAKAQEVIQEEQQQAMDLEDNEWKVFDQHVSQATRRRSVALMQRRGSFQYGVEDMMVMGKSLSGKAARRGSVDLGSLTSSQQHQSAPQVAAGEVPQMGRPRTEAAAKLDRLHAVFRRADEEICQKSLARLVATAEEVRPPSKEIEDEMRSTFMQRLQQSAADVKTGLDSLFTIEKPAAAHLGSRPPSKPEVGKMSPASTMCEEDPEAEVAMSRTGTRRKDSLTMVKAPSIKVAVEHRSKSRTPDIEQPKLRQITFRRKSEPPVPAAEGTGSPSHTKGRRATVMSTSPPAAAAIRSRLDGKHVKDEARPAGAPESSPQRQGRSDAQITLSADGVSQTMSRARSASRGQESSVTAPEAPAERASSGEEAEEEPVKAKESTMKARRSSITHDFLQGVVRRVVAPWRSSSVGRAAPTPAEQDRQSVSDSVAEQNRRSSDSVIAPMASEEPPALSSAAEELVPGAGHADEAVEKLEADSGAVHPGLLLATVPAASAEALEEPTEGERETPEASAMAPTPPAETEAKQDAASAETAPLQNVEEAGWTRSQMPLPKRRLIPPSPPPTLGNWPAPSTYRTEPRRLRCQNGHEVSLPAVACPAWAEAIMSASESGGGKATCLEAICSERLEFARKMTEPQVQQTPNRPADLPPLTLNELPPSASRNGGSRIMAPHRPFGTRMPIADTRHIVPLSPTTDRSAEEQQARMPRNLRQRHVARSAISASLSPRHDIGSLAPPLPQPAKSARGGLRNGWREGLAKVDEIPQGLLHPARRPLAHRLQEARLE